MSHPHAALRVGGWAGGRVGGNLGFHFHTQFVVRRASHLRDRPHDKGQEHEEKHHSVGPPYVPMEGQHTEQHGDAKEHRKPLAQDSPVHENGSDHRGHAKDEADVGDVGTQGVSKGQLGLAARGGEYGHHEFGSRGAESDDEHSHQERRHPEVSRHRRGTVHKSVGAPRKPRQADDRRENHGTTLPGPLCWAISPARGVFDWNP